MQSTFKVDDKATREPPYAGKNKVALGRHRQRQQPEHALQPTKLLKAVCFLDALTLGDGEDPPIRRSARKTPGGQPVIPENSGAPAQWPRAQKRFKGEARAKVG